MHIEKYFIGITLYVFVHIVHIYIASTGELRNWRNGVIGHEMELESYFFPPQFLQVYTHSTRLSSTLMHRCHLNGCTCSHCTYIAFTGASCVIGEMESDKSRNEVKTMIQLNNVYKHMLSTRLSWSVMHIYLRNILFNTGAYSIPGSCVFGEMESESSCNV